MKLALAGLISALLTTGAFAECNTKYLNLSARDYPQVGTVQYHQTLPLNDNEVVLTFDDGPHPKYTPQILKILRDNCVKATFFVIGQMVNHHGEIITREIAEGHSVGTHSFSHPYNFGHLSNAKAEQEISWGIASPTAIIGHQLSPIFRFPGLGKNHTQESWLGRLGISIWSVDINPEDWKGGNTAQIVGATMSQLAKKKKGIIILHDIHKNTVDALPTLLLTLRQKGYIIVGVRMR